MSEMVALDRTRAACRDQDPELFFPLGASGPAVLQAHRAKAVCRRCPVVDNCLDWAIGHDERYGVWGGMTEEERAQEFKVRNAAVLRTLPAVPTARSHDTSRSSSALAEARYQRALKLHQSGKELEDIAWEMQIAVGTVEKYIRAAER